MRYAALGNWVKELSSIERAILCLTLNQFANAGVYADDTTLPFFTRIITRDALLAAEPYLSERGQFLLRRLLQQVVSMEETSGENSRNN